MKSEIYFSIALCMTINENLNVHLNLILGIVLFTFLHFNETPAIVTSVVIGLGIVFCGGAVIHNVFIWQRVRLNSVNENKNKISQKSETFTHLVSWRANYNFWLVNNHRDQINFCVELQLIQSQNALVFSCFSLVESNDTHHSLVATNKRMKDSECSVDLT